MYTLPAGLLKSIRDQKKFKLTIAAESVNMTATALSEIESGFRLIKDSEVPKICKIYGILPNIFRQYVTKRFSNADIYKLFLDGKN